MYANRENIAPLNSDLAIYLDYVVLEQVIPAKNSSQNLEYFECLPNEVKLVVALYDVVSDKFWGLDKRLVFIMVRVDHEETFFSHGYNKSKSNLIYLVAKKFCRIYLSEPALKNINNLYLTNG